MRDRERQEGRNKHERNEEQEGRDKEEKGENKGERGTREKTVEIKGVIGRSNKR